MNKKNIFFGLVSFLALQFVIAQTDKFVEDLQTKYNTTFPYKMDFSYKFTNASGEVLFKDQKGSLQGEANKFVLKLLDQDLISNGKIIYTINHEDEEIVVQKIGESEIDFASIMDVLKKGNTKYSYKLIANRKLLVVTPKNNPQFKSIVIQYNDKKDITNFIQKNSDNSIVSVKVLSFSKSQRFPLDFFSIKKTKYSNYYITTLD